MDPSLIISLAAFVSSFVVPLITNIFNSKTQIKIRKIDLYDEHHVAALERYVRCASAFIHNPTDSNRSAYGEVYGEVFFHSPPDVWDSIQDLHSKIFTSKAPGTHIPQFSDICIRLAECSPLLKTQSHAKKSPRKKRSSSSHC